jgi:hypothetical protein
VVISSVHRECRFIPVHALPACPQYQFPLFLKIQEMDGFGMLYMKSTDHALRRCLFCAKKVKKIKKIKNQRIAVGRCLPCMTTTHQWRLLEWHNLALENTDLFQNQRILRRCTCHGAMGRQPSVSNMSERAKCIRPCRRITADRRSDLQCIKVIIEIPSEEAGSFQPIRTSCHLKPRFFEFRARGRNFSFTPSAA